MDALRITELSIAHFALPLVKPFGAPGHAVTSREGVVVRLAAEDGSEGFGEIAPLPGLHPESTAQVVTWLRAFSPRVLGTPPRSLRDAMLAGKAPPIVMWGLDAAHAGLFAAQHGEHPVTRLIRERQGGSGDRRVAVSGLFDGDEAALEVALESLARYPAVKVKIGRRPVATDRAVLARLASALPDARLRLDANRQLDLETACTTVGDLPAERVEYVEDPLANAAELARFHERTGLAVALDELLDTPEAPELVALDCVTTLILKPTTMGGVMETVFASVQAAGTGRRVVVSSTVESGLGLWHLAQVAAAVQDPGVAAGLGTDRLLADDIVAPRFDSSRGFVSVADWTGRPSERFIASAEWETLGTTS